MSLVRGADTRWRQNGSGAMTGGIALPGNSIFKPLDVYREFSRTKHVQGSVRPELQSRDDPSSEDWNTNYTPHPKPQRVNFMRDKIANRRGNDSSGFNYSRSWKQPRQKDADREKEKEREKKRMEREKYQRKKKEEQERYLKHKENKKKRKARPEEPEVEEEEEDPESVMKIITDDKNIPSQVRDASDLPGNRYKSLSMILKPSGPKYNQPETRFCLKNPVPVLASRPGYVTNKVFQPISLLSVRNAISVSTEEISDAGTGFRKPPEPFPEVMEDRPPWEADTISQQHSQQTAPSTLRGVIWPRNYASDPPYVTPGYRSPGIRQPTGVVARTDALVPAGPRTAVVNGEEKKVPAWVSPLYRPYGIGGPYGPNGPFFRPCRDLDFMTQAFVQRQAIRCPLKRQYIKWRYGQDATQQEALVEAVKASLDNAKRRVDSRRKHEDFLREVLSILAETSEDVRKHVPALQAEHTRRADSTRMAADSGYENLSDIEPGSQVHSGDSYPPAGTPI